MLNNSVTLFFYMHFHESVFANIVLPPLPPSDHGDKPLVASRGAYFEAFGTVGGIV